MDLIVPPPGAEDPNKPAEQGQGQAQAVRQYLHRGQVHPGTVHETAARLSSRPRTREFVAVPRRLARPSGSGREPPGLGLTTTDASSGPDDRAAPTLAAALRPPRCLGSPSARLVRPPPPRPALAPRPRPYRIWVSEVMLQQTQAATVVPYFERFLQAFPTLAALAAADEQDVLRLWEGLGYYRRRPRPARKTARLAGRATPAVSPTTPTPSTACPAWAAIRCNAVLSQAFDRRLPILEANSQRVLARLFGRTGDPRRGPEQRWLWAAAEALLPARRVGDFNQALMELGALVCTPAAPRCGDCPLAGDCVARRLGRQESIPARHGAAGIRRRAGGRGGRAPRPRRAAGAATAAGTLGVAVGVPARPADAGRVRRRAAARLLPELTGLRRTARVGAGDAPPRRHALPHHAGLLRGGATFPANSAPPFTSRPPGCRRVSCPAGPSALRSAGWPGSSPTLDGRVASFEDRFYSRVRRPGLGVGGWPCGTPCASSC